MVVPVVDRMPLFSWIGADVLPGVTFDLVAPPSMQWRGRPHYVEHDQAVVINGGCGNAGCCGVMATIQLEDSAVRWSDFVIGYSRPIELGPFEFDREVYERTIDQVASLPAVRWLLERVSVDNVPTVPMRERIVDRVGEIVAWPRTAWHRRQLRRQGVAIMSIRRNRGWYVEPNDPSQTPDDGQASHRKD